MGQGVLQIGGGLEAVLLAPGQRLAHGDLQLLLDLRVLGLDGRHLGVADQLDGLVIGLAVKEALPRQHLVEQDPDREDVGTIVDLIAARGLGGQVAHLTLHHARIGGLELAGGLGQTKIHDLDLPLLGDEDIGWGDVSMHDAQRPARLRVEQLVGIGQALANFVDDVQGGRDGQALADASTPFEQALQIDAVHVLHDDEERVIRVADVEDLNDVSVLQRQGEPRLVEKHGHELLVLGQRRQDALDGDVLLEPLQRLRDPPKDLGHAARGYPLGDAISAIGH